jgi:pimeloyl-ACP methyl ester carboxylesterase
MIEHEDQVAQASNNMHGFIEANRVRLHYVTDGTNDGEPLVLLHGFPQSWVMWRRVWAALAARHRVIAVDLRGYGESGKPPGVECYDKGTMAADVRAVVQHLGLGHFVLVGHDRGGRVARRYALDYPDDLAGVALLDILPVEYVYDHYTAAEIARRYWHWVFHLVPELPEQLIAGHEEEYLARFFARTPGLLDRMQADGAWQAYRDTFLQPGAVTAALNDYRATYAVDVPRYRAEQAAGKRLTVPTLLLWGENGNLAERQPLDIWRAVADDVRGAPIPDCGHYLPEEQPEIVQERLLAFARACFDAP